MSRILTRKFLADSIAVETGRSKSRVKFDAAYACIPVNNHMKHNVTHAQLNVMLQQPLVFRHTWACHESILKAMDKLGITKEAETDRDVSSGRVYTIIHVNKTSKSSYVDKLLNYDGTVVMDEIYDLQEVPRVYTVTRAEKISLLLILLFDKSVFGDAPNAHPPPTILPWFRVFDPTSIVLVMNSDPDEHTFNIASQPLFDANTLNQHYQRISSSSSSSNNNRSQKKTALDARSCVWVTMGLVDIACKFDAVRPIEPIGTDILIGATKLVMRLVFTKHPTIPEPLSLVELKTLIDSDFYTRVDGNRILKDKLDRIVQLAFKLRNLTSSQSMNIEMIYDDYTSAHIRRCCFSLFRCALTTASLPTSLESAGIDVGGVDQLANTMARFAVSDIKTHREMLSMAVDTLDYDLHAVIQSRKNAASLLYCVFGGPGLNSSIIRQTINHIQTNSSIANKEEIFVDDVYDDTTETYSVCVSGTRRSLYLLNMLSWCMTMNKHRSSNRDIPRALVIGPHHIVSAAVGDSGKLIADSVWGMFHGLMGGSNFSDKSPNDAIYKESVFITLCICKDDYHCVSRGMPSLLANSNVFMQDTMILMLFPLCKCIVHEDNWNSLLSLLPDTYRVKFHDSRPFAPSSSSSAAYINERHEKDMLRDTMIPPQRRRVLCRNDEAMNNPSRFVELTDDQRIAVLQQVYKLFISNDLASQNQAWQLLHYLCVYLPCTMHYVEMLFPRDGNHFVTSYLLQQTTTSYNDAILNPVKPSLYGIFSELCKQVVTNPRQMHHTNNDAHQKEANKIVRRALLCACLVAMGHYTSLADPGVRWCDNSHVLWLDSMVCHPTNVFIPNNDLSCSLHSSLFLPSTIDVGTPFSPFLLATIDRMSEHTPDAYTIGLNKVKTYMKLNDTKQKRPSSSSSTSSSSSSSSTFHPFVIPSIQATKDDSNPKRKIVYGSDDDGGENDDNNSIATASSPYQHKRTKP